MKSSLFHINADGSLAAMLETPYESEDHIQRLLAEHPEVLAGDQFTPEEPRRWVLVAREIAIQDGEKGPKRWSLDHLYLDQDGVPTLVEVKRRQDTRSRREVVGQMFDYAANGPAYWPIEEIIQTFEGTQQAQGREPQETLSDLIGEAGDPESFWKQVEANLESGRIRMVFVVDEMPPELLRIVEFLSRQLKDAEVYAVEVRQHVGQTGKILTTRVVGQSAVTQVRRAAQERRPSEAEWLSTFEARHGADKTATAKAIIGWMKEIGAETFTTSSQTPSFGMIVREGERKRYPLFLTGNGKAAVSLAYLSYATAFAADERRREIVKRLSYIPGLEHLQSTNLGGDARIPLELLADEERRKGFLEVIDWIARELRGE